MEALVKKILAWFRRRGSAIPSKTDSGNTETERGSGRRDSPSNRSERFLALSPATSWIAEGEAEYEVERGGSGSAPPAKPNRQALLESPVPDGVAPFGHPGAGVSGGARPSGSLGSSGSSGFAAAGFEETVTDGFSGKEPEQSGPADKDDGDGRRNRRGHDGRQTERHDRPKWSELWEADGLLSHDGTYLRFQSWSGGHDVEVLIGDMAAEIDDDELKLTGSNFRFVIEDIEPITPPSGIRPDLVRARPSHKGDRFGGLLAEFPHLGSAPT